VGCSGWQYRDWRGVVYPAGVPQRSWLPYYATLFDTVEVNNSFYRLPSESAVSGWAASVPPGFVFALKLGAFGSHRMKLRDAASWLPNHMVRVELLGDAAGPTLVQLPPRWRRNAERLDEFLTVAPPTTRWAVEVRERSWLHDEIYDVLARHHAALCVHDLLEDHPFVLTTDWTYLRFHGPDALVRKYYGAYGYRRLRQWATRLSDVLDSGRDVYCYFNNDWEGHAVADASWLRQALDSRQGDRHE
jgi:uncharacterized protein YecE (DUF72 family)